MFQQFVLILTDIKFFDTKKAENSPYLIIERVLNIYTFLQS